MKSKTNISVKDIRGVRITPSIELGDNQEYTSGDILDANATLNLVKQKIDDVINGASSAADTLKEIEDIIYTIDQRLTGHDNAINGISQSLNYANATANQALGVANGAASSIDSLKRDINGYDSRINSLGNTINELRSNITTVTDDVNDLRNSIIEFHPEAYRFETLYEQNVKFGTITGTYCLYKATNTPTVFDAGDTIRVSLDGQIQGVYTAKDDILSDYIIAKIQSDGSSSSDGNKITIYVYDDFFDFATTVFTEVGNHTLKIERLVK